MNLSKLLFGRIVMLGFVVCLSQPVPAVAGKIYKWVDKNGNVQFSNTPGPDQSVDAHIGKTGAERSLSSTRTSTSKGLFDGFWYGTERGVSYRLRFNKNFMSWGRGDGSSNSSFPIFKAKWEYVNSDLEITYTRHWKDSNKQGKRERIRIIDKSEDNLTLQFPNKHLYHLAKRVKHRNVGLEGKGLIGKWIRKSDGAETIFKSGSFVTKKEVVNRTGRIAVERGNWRVRNGVLVLTFMGGMDTKGKVGTDQKYNILLSEEQQLILEDVKTRERVRYKRKLLR